MNSTLNYIERRCQKLKISEIKLNPYPSCCHSLISYIELRILCSNSNKLNYNNETNEISKYNDRLCSNNRILNENNENSLNLLISSCALYVDYYESNNLNRNLQFDINFLPTPLSLISSGNNIGDFNFQGNSPCALTLSMYFIRTCGRECNINRPTIAGISNLPVACMAECVQLSKDFCISGCKRYGCSIGYYDCMNLLCGG
ncbi:hypothetical protein FG386_001490 [Cryptosporidium ryanae]|uniref:uncharacterized protein n=1 Tax=Cryptosporidium ryanae TaxID=515981 RepID=UPI00351A1CE5|nr:hypothetical protein FG386_001490 [Cryptosporidium ryanae]